MSRSNASAALEQFLASHPQNPWRASLWLDIGLADRTSGRFSAVIHAFEQARATVQASRDLALRPIAVRALSEQLTLETRLGHEQSVTQLLHAAQHLGMSAQDSLAMSLAENGLWDMQQHPESAFQCGWIALRALWQTQGFHVNTAPSLPMDAAHPGYSLGQLVTMAAQMHQPVVAVHLAANATIPVPSVVHWKSGHFATIVAEDHGHYQVADPTLEGGLARMTAAAVHDESSGYFLVPAANGELAMSERPVNAHEATTVRGAGYTTSNNPHGFPSGCNQSCTGSNGSSGGVNGAGGGTGGATPGAVSAPSPSPSTGMPTYSISPMLVSLSLTDTPLSYAPPKASHTTGRVTGLARTAVDMAPAPTSTTQAPIN
ncbi:cysteine peptidase family C39 domain-containing protein [Dyella monticola]|uniref:cysteine peptidase family C39 domain-containing protein n=1 Tax=Dyella monticola TaxID=1927958 RepID=UPI00131427BF|nr:cysteine peptidase family C39 domain-containing protein [Dyella monticola]